MTRSLRLSAATITGVLVAALTGGVLGWTSSVFRQSEFRSGLSVILRNLNSQVDVAAGQIAAEESIGQTFQATRANLSRVDIRLATYGRTNEAPVVLTLSTYPSMEPIRRAVAARGGIRDGQYHTFSFPPVPKSSRMTFLLTLNAPESAPGNPLSSWAGNCDCYPGGVAFLNGKPEHELDLTLRIGYLNPVTDVMAELIGRLSQYKPGFFKGEALPLVAALALGLTIATVAYFTLSLITDEVSDEGSAQSDLA